MRWTDEQQAAIDAPKPGGLPSQTLLVAAAAGSGKTAVLAERILKRLSNKESPLSVQELLVVTFTRAAAAEMRSRIGAKLAEAFERTGDTYLEQQLSLLPSAQISTLHSFCQKVIRDYFYRLDIAPDFRIANEGELALMKDEAIDAVLASAYESGACDIFALSDMLNDDRSDDRLKGLIRQLYEFALSQPDPEMWLEAAVAQYESAVSTDDNIWACGLLDEQRRSAAQLADTYREMIRLVDMPGGPYIWRDKLAEVGLYVSRIGRAETWDEMHDAIAACSGFKYPTLSPGKKNPDPPIDAAMRMRCKILSDAVKGSLHAMAGGAFALSSDAVRREAERQAPLVRGLVELVRRFMHELAERKREAGVLDFSDMEHFCLQLLRNEDGEPSDVALELRGRFRDVMVDEYQDTNAVQEAIVNLVSRTDNRFYVGDVKQSIYRFRMADPGLFMEKYGRFGRDLEDGERRIDLAKNFRSDANILTFINFIFRQIMSADAAELDYGDAEALYPGRVVEYAPDSWVGGPVEIHLLETRGGREEETEEGEERFDLAGNDERETALIIDRIRTLFDSGATVQDTDGSFRPIRYRDIVVLRRSLAGDGHRMTEAFRAAGIPAYAEDKNGYFGAIEVRLFLSLLQVIDNPQQDLPMAAVLRSAFVGMTAEELAGLRLHGDGCLYAELPGFAEAQGNARWKDFVRRFESWRDDSRRHGVSTLIRKILDETGYEDYVGTLPNGALRRANIEALYDRAKQYESGAFRGLFRFLRFIESLQAAGEDLGMAKTVGESDDVVRIMTIHKSKGLEFPVVFLSGIRKKFNMRDTTNPMLLHKEAGIGLKGYFDEYRLLYPSLPWLHNRMLIERANKAEEERVLYVALTRAKDKLFITGHMGGSKTLASYCGVSEDGKEKDSPVKQALACGTETLPRDTILGASSFTDWILPALSRHVDGSRLRAEAGVEETAIPTLRDRACRFEVRVYPADAFEEKTARTSGADRRIVEAISRGERLPGAPLPKEVAARLDYIYAHDAAVMMPAKISVSEIKRRFAAREEAAVELADIARGGAAPSMTDSFTSTPRKGTIAGSEMTRSGRKAMSAAERGTLMHEAMQRLAIRRYDAAAVDTAIESFVVDGYFSREEADVLDAEGLALFFESDIGRRLIAAEEAGVRIERELPFSLLFDAARVYPERFEAGEEELFLQGILDVAFIENDAWILIDYKTDRVKSADVLRRRYDVQIGLYREALERLTGIPVAESYLYAFALKKSVRIDK